MSLKILMVAPQPFFRPRGTPFSVLHRIRALAAVGHRVDLITYPFGEDVPIPGLSIRRSTGVPFVRDVKVGPSVAKLLLDVPVFFATVSALRNERYDVVHSHEEAAFFCAPLARKFRALHVYDMHSSLPQQLTNFESFNFAPIRKVFERLEHRVLTTAHGVITICKDLADVALPKCNDTSHALIENAADDTMIFGQEQPADEAWRVDFPGRRVLLYTGTFEPYQGLDLLLDAFALARTKVDDAHLVLVGGRPRQVETYKSKALDRRVLDSTTFVGQVHPSRIQSYIDASEVIVSPRIGGTNTPLKIYGYLRSGRPIVATDMHTHTQTLNANVAALVPPTREGLAEGIVRVFDDRRYAKALAKAARKLSDAEYSDDAYMRKVADFYRSVAERIRLVAVAATAMQWWSDASVLSSLMTL
jgi:glycosyltransferase involved in cell wall biosynthesis